MPDVGGDTIWANTVAGYEWLPNELRDLADTLRIVHTNTHDYAKPTSREDIERGDQRAPAAVRVDRVPHGASGCALSIPRPASVRSCSAGSRNRSTGFRRRRRVISSASFRSTSHGSRTLCDGGGAPATSPIWDNRATQHIAVYDYGDAHRRAERVTVAGPVPVGVDGRTSVALEGNASDYYAGAVDDGVTRIEP